MVSLEGLGGKMGTVRRRRWRNKVVDGDDVRGDSELDSAVNGSLGRLQLEKDLDFLRAHLSSILVLIRVLTFLIRLFSITN